MVSLSFLLAALIVAAGPLVGWLLAWACREEMKAGKRWLALFQQALFVAAAGSFLVAHKWMLWPMVIGATALFAYLSFEEFRHPALAYFLLGIAFALIAKTPFLLALSSTAFLFGLPTGSLSRSWLPSAVFLLTALGLGYL